MADSPLKRTPLFENHRRAGGKMVDFAGWEMPVQYSGLMDEHRAVRTAAGLFDVSHMGQVRVTGPGAEAYLQRLTPNDVSKLVPGRAHYDGLLDQEGHYLDDILVYRLAAEEFLVVVNASNADSDFAWMSSQPHPDAALHNVSEDWALLALQGPRAPAILARLSPADLAAIKYYRFAEGSVAGKPAILSRTGYTGEDGFELYFDNAQAAHIWNAIMASGEVTPAGLGCRDSLRLEMGMALYGNDIDDTVTPLEANLAWIVKLQKGEFVGRNALVAQKEQGLAKKLVGFTTSERAFPRHGYPVICNGEPSGVVCSGTLSPTLNIPIGTCYLPTANAQPGNELGIDIRGKIVKAEVVKLPFYKSGSHL
jgi:aminomethyltransferase